MKTIIHVNQHNIKFNSKNKNDKRKVLTVKTYKTNTYCDEVKFASGRVIYSPDNPLPCGAKVWIETNEPVEIIYNKF
jgi:hypothetical protein